MQKEIKNIINESCDVKKKIADNLSNEIEEFVNIIIGCYKKDNKVMICGNGGSAADSQHISAEFVGRYKKERKGLPCIALTTDTSILTAWSNDYDFETVFERQVASLGKEGDVLIGLSTSGNSKNVIKAFEKAKEMKIKTISLLGKDGGKSKNMADIELIMPSNNTARIQEAHITILHIMCELVEKELF